MQAGVKMDATGEHPQSRIGINVALCDHTALVKLLFSKGVITEGEYWKSCADEMEGEVRRYEEALSRGGKVKIILVGAHGSIHDAEIVS